ncbi:MAG: hypothetical protein HQL76_02490 [Magnetococcales bacterium]|nr:hypothetical protein [Magnetococcales bacterium]
MFTGFSLLFKEKAVMLAEQESAIFPKVKAGFVEQGTTFTAWCRQRKVNTSNAKAALLGAWTGPKARALKAELLVAAKISQIQPNGE